MRLEVGGALGEDGRWKQTKGNYLFPVKALSRHFRGRMVSLLRRASEDGELPRITRKGEIDAVLAARPAPPFGYGAAPPARQRA